MSDSELIVFKLKGVSELAEGKNYYSEPHTIGGIPWRLNVAIREVEQVDDTSKRVWVHLDASLHNFEDKSYVVKFKTTLVNQGNESGTGDNVKSSGYIFPNPTSGSKAMGPRFIDYERLLDPNNGWLIDDTMLIKCEVDVEWVRLSDKVENVFTFPFMGVEAMPVGNKYFSEPVTEMGIRWRLCAIAKMVEKEKYLGLFVQAVKEDFNERRFYFTYKATLISPSGSKPDLNDVESSGIYPDPVTGGVSQGNSTVFKFSDMTNPSNGWVAKGMISIIWKFSVMEILKTDEEIVKTNGENDGENMSDKKHEPQEMSEIDV